MLATVGEQAALRQQGVRLDLVDGTGDARACGKRRQLRLAKVGDADRTRETQTVHALHAAPGLARVNQPRLPIVTRLLVVVLGPRTISTAREILGHTLGAPPRERPVHKVEVEPLEPKR